MFTAPAIWRAENSSFPLTSKPSLRISKTATFVSLCACTNSAGETRGSNFARAANNEASEAIRNAIIRIMLLHKFGFVIYAFAP